MNARKNSKLNVKGPALAQHRPLPIGHRRGLAGVRLESRLHVMAHNISRGVAYVLRRARGIEVVGCAFRPASAS